MVGHTHCDVDQFFSLISRKIWPKSIHTIPQLLDLIKNVTKAYPVHAKEIKAVRDYNKLLPVSGERIMNITLSHIFQFTHDDGGNVKLLCKAWAESTEWVQLANFPISENAQIPKVQEKKELEDFMAHFQAVREKLMLTEEEAQVWTDFHDNDSTAVKEVGWHLSDFPTYDQRSQISAPSTNFHPAE